MPHLRLYVPEEWLREDFQRATGFDAKKLLDRLVQVVADYRMENPARDDRGNRIGPETVPMINLHNLKHAIVPLYYAHVGGDPAQRFLHATLQAGNDTPGRTAAVRRQAAQLLGDEIDQFVGRAARVDVGDRARAGHRPGPRLFDHRGAEESASRGAGVENMTERRLCENARSAPC